jgi:hypothetical protein
MQTAEDLREIKSLDKLSFYEKKELSIQLAVIRIPSGFLYVFDDGDHVSMTHVDASNLRI